MKMHSSVTQQRIIDAVMRRTTSLDDPGICILCGEDADGVEPDARKYECESCGKRGVYGVEELMAMMPV